MCRCAAVGWKVGEVRLAVREGRGEQEQVRVGGEFCRAGGGAGGAGVGQGLPAVLDADGDGAISSDEIAGAAVSLRKLDKNGDGQLTAEEYRPEPPKRDGEQGNRPNGPRDGNGPKPPPKDGDNNKAGGEAKKRPAAE